MPLTGRIGKFCDDVCFIWHVWRLFRMMCRRFGFGMIGFLGASQQMAVPGKAAREVWYQNAGFVWIPLIIIGAIVAWMFLKSVPITANIRQQFDIFNNPDTWYMTLLYVMTFGIYSGLAAQFALIINNSFGKDSVFAQQGYSDLPTGLTYAFLGPLIGAGARVLFSPLTDRMGGAIWTLISGIGVPVIRSPQLTSMSSRIRS